MLQSLRLFGILTFRQVAQHRCSDTACNRGTDKLSSGNPVHFLHLSFIRYGRMQSYVSINNLYHLIFFFNLFYRIEYNKNY